MILLSFLKHKASLIEKQEIELHGQHAWEEGDIMRLWWSTALQEGISFTTKRQFDLGTIWKRLANREVYNQHCLENACNQQGRRSHIHHSIRVCKARISIHSNEVRDSQAFTYSDICGSGHANEGCLKRHVKEVHGPVRDMKVET